MAVTNSSYIVKCAVEFVSLQRGDKGLKKKRQGLQVRELLHILIYEMQMGRLSNSELLKQHEIRMNMVLLCPVEVEACRCYEDKLDEMAIEKNNGHGKESP